MEISVSINKVPLALCHPQSACIVCICFLTPAAMPNSADRHHMAHETENNSCMALDRRRPPRPSLELFKKHPDLWRWTSGSRDPLSHLLIECGPVGGHRGSFRQDQKTPTCVWLCSVFGQKHTSDSGKKNQWIGHCGHAFWGERR